MIVNDVAGFIGPEVFATPAQLERACLEDTVMAKLHGLTMGLDVCATFHMGIPPATLRGADDTRGSAGRTRVSHGGRRERGSDAWLSHDIVSRVPGQPARTRENRDPLDAGTPHGARRRCGPGRATASERP